MQAHQFIAVPMALLAGVSIALQTQAQASRAAEVTAGMACPELAGVERWAKSHVKDYSYTEVFCGDFDADGHKDAIAFLHFPLGGNNESWDVVLFRNVGGALRYLRPVPNLYGSPESAAFSRGQVVLNMVTMRPDDPRCCHPGAHGWSWTLKGAHTTKLSLGKHGDASKACKGVAIRGA